MSDHTPVLATTDAVVLAPRSGDLHVLLIERRWPPFAGAYALPGGHLEPGESLAEGAARELAEETGLKVPAEAMTQVGAYGDPDRDPRGRVLTVAYVAVLDHAPEPTAADDAAAAEWVPVSAVLDASAPLAFDHHQIVTDAVDAIRRRDDREQVALTGVLIGTLIADKD